ncbi:adenylyl-sulfate kinase [Cohnella sp. AR92]|uniref:adenylyl-sulfate kinase n=1 Tax=Cohnella sp. AR92 TaxID=648716 RepID=UPI000F8D76FB|nr:adenylyl-sulfate kinase [Cohnella sp. AR92]RUS42651.1 adenylyl-sulfate kinase [Cohnella sp. AR92]
MNLNSGNVTWQHSKLTRQDRQRRNGHPSCVLWFTGLPGSGKSTLAFALEKELESRKMASYVLDGDNIRHGLGRDLGFSEADRAENIRRVGEVSKLFVDAGLIALSAFISPSEADRRKVRELFPNGDFIEVYVKCSLKECEKRDPKGLYKKAREGRITSFTGIDAGYDVPVNPELVLDTESLSVDEAVAVLIGYLDKRGGLRAE